MSAPGIALVVLVIVVVAIVAFLNSLIRKRNLVTQSWHLVDVELQRRHDLVPNLVATVQGYAAHEQTTLAQVIEARRAALAVTGAASAQDAERALGAGLRDLLALAEAYPDLHADAHFLDLQRALRETEDRIAVARRVYNANVRDYNDAIQQVPGAIFAAGGRFVAAAPFAIDPVLRAAGPPSVGGGSAVRP